MSEQDFSIQGIARKIDEASSYSEWVQWFCLLLVVTVAIAVAAPYDHGVEYSMYATMAILALFAFYSSYKDVSALDKELKSASRQMKQLIEDDDIEFFLEKTEQAQDYSYFRSHIASLYKIYTLSQEIHQDTLIETLNSKLLAKNRKVELFSSILITIGLIGTIIGLIFMMQKMSTDIAPVLQEGGNVLGTLMRENGALSGLGIAFVTTLLGAIFGGVILRILTSIVEEGIVKYVALLAELTEVNVLPILRAHAASREMVQPASE